MDLFRNHSLGLLWKSIQLEQRGSVHQRGGGWEESSGLAPSNPGAGCQQTLHNPWEKQGPARVQAERPRSGQRGSRPTVLSQWPKADAEGGAEEQNKRIWGFPRVLFQDSKNFWVRYDFCVFGSPQLCPLTCLFPAWKPVQSSTIHAFLRQEVPHYNQGLCQKRSLFIGFELTALFCYLLLLALYKAEDDQSLCCLMPDTISRSLRT